MKLLQHGFPWLAAAMGALVLAACTDRDGSPGSVPTGPGTAAPPGEPVLLQAVDCRVEVRTLRVKCGPTGGGEGAPSHLIVGGQNEYVALTSTSPDYDPGTQLFTMDVTVRNLIPQPLGTSDTIPPLSPDANRVRVFFSTPPVATAGTGAIDVVEDGKATFLSADQDYYQYNALLDPFEVTVPRKWTFNVPATVESFHFGVYVAAAVPWPDGYVVISGNFDVRSAAERQLTARAYNVVGELDPAATAFVWESLDSTRAAVHAANGLAHGRRAGSAVIVATEAGGAGRHGKVVMDVSPIRRTWTGAAGVTGWENGANWLPDSIAPQPTDTAEINDNAATLFPVLSQNETVGGLEVLDLAPGGVVPTVGLGAFALHSGGDVIVTNASEITGTGRLYLEGIVANVQGTLPRVEVTGRYVLTGNVTSRASLRIVGGRLRSESFRIRTLSN